MVSRGTAGCDTKSPLHFAGGLRGASIIDSLDTLYIMGLMDEYNDAKEWVKTSLDLNSVRNFKFSLQTQSYIKLMKFSAVTLRAGSILTVLLCFNAHIVSTEFDGFPTLGTLPQESKASCVATGHTVLPAGGILFLSMGLKARKRGGGMSLDN